MRERLAEELAAVEQRQLEAHVDRRRSEVAGAVADAERGGGVGLQLKLKLTLGFILEYIGI